MQDEGRIYIKQGKEEAHDQGTDQEANGTEDAEATEHREHDHKAMDLDAAAHEERREEVVDQPYGRTAPDRQRDPATDMPGEEKIQHCRYHDKCGANARDERGKHRNRAPQRGIGDTGDRKPDATQEALDDGDNERSADDGAHGHLQSIDDLSVKAIREGTDLDKLGFEVRPALEQKIRRDQTNDDVEEKLGDARENSTDVLKQPGHTLVDVDIEVTAKELEPLAQERAIAQRQLGYALKDGLTLGEQVFALADHLHTQKRERYEHHDHDDEDGEERRSSAVAAKQGHETSMQGIEQNGKGKRKDQRGKERLDHQKKQDDRPGEKRKKEKCLYGSMRHSAEAGGFEPPIPFRIYRISSAAHSTSLARFQYTKRSLLLTYFQDCIDKVDNPSVKKFLKNLYLEL